MVERMPDQRLDEVVWGVVGAGGRSRGALTEAEPQLAPVAVEFWLGLK